MRTLSRKKAQELLALLQLAQKEDHQLQEYLQDAGLTAQGEQYSLELEEEVLAELRDDSRGVTNSFLEHCLKAQGITVQVQGTITDFLIECPCCHSFSLQDHAEHDICLVCWWQDDGTVDEKQYSSPNHQTLKEGRANFKALGSSDENLLNSPNQLPFLEKYPVL